MRMCAVISVIWSVEGICFDLEQSQIRKQIFFQKKKIYFHSYVRNIFWVTVYYKYHVHVGFTVYCFCRLVSTIAIKISYSCYYFVENQRRANVYRKEENGMIHYFSDMIINEIHTVHSYCQKSHATICTQRFLKFNRILMFIELIKVWYLFLTTFCWFSC